MRDTGGGFNEREAKRPKYEPGQDLLRSSALKAFTHTDYTVGWICPLQIELIAALEMLDEEHAKLPQQPADHNVYHLGSISGHNVVIAGMWQAGNPTAATVVAQMRMTFPNIRFGLLVGIGDGVPVVTEHGMIRLGHVVVSKPTGQSSGAIQYDRGKAEDGIFVRTGALALPPPVLLLAADSLGAQRARSREDPLLQNIQRIDTSLPGLRCYKFPGNNKDYLFPAEYKHLRPRTSCEAGQCDLSQQIFRDEDEIYAADKWITVHRGTIASGEVVLKDAVKRDLLGQESGVLCFEMEGAGALSDFPCLVIRGISDYCDSHKNDEWHGFASAAAAAYARQLFFHMPIDKKLSLVPVDDPGIKRIVGRSDDEERHKIVEWISSTNYTTSQADILSQRCEGTGQWLLDVPEFGDWVKKKGILYCPGIPGAGKTTLVSIVINHLQEIFAKNQQVVVAYIFCDYREQSKQKLNNILGAILKQLVQPMETLPDDLNMLYKSHQATGSTLQRNELTELLISVANYYSRVYLVIDALDECPDSDGTRSTFISHLLKLQKNCNVNLLATSRFIPDITARFGHFPSVEVRASDADVALYTEGRIHEFNCVRKNPALSKLVVSSITKTSDGMFLLAKLYLNSLKGEPSVKSIKSALSRLQSGSGAYDNAYQKVMERIEHQIAGQASLAKRLLSWLTCARRSLTLTELQHALAVETDQSFFDEENLPDIEDMISVCAGLVTYSEESHIIALVHYTAKEYFEREWSSWFPHAQGNIGRICVTYLCYDSFESGCCETLEDYEERCRRYPLYNYAASNWGFHAQRQRLDHELVFQLLENDKKRAACAQSLIWSDHTYGIEFWKIPKDTTALQLTVELGLLYETEYLLKSHHDVNVHSDFFDTPIITAISSGNEDLVRLLLRHGACPGDMSDFGATLVSISASMGHEALLGLALELGVDPELGDRNDRSPLSYAAENGHVKAAKMLLDAKADIERKDKWNGRTPLAWAAANGQQAVVRLLLEAGARPDTKTTGSAIYHVARTPLSLAAQNGKREVVELLLEKNVDPDEPDANGRTPLSWAAGEGHLDIVRDLLAAGANIDRMDAPKDGLLCFGRTPLGWATRSSQQAVVELLLEKGANPNSFTEESPLSTAVQSKDAQLVELLLRYGADPNPNNRLRHSDILGYAILVKDRRMLRSLVRYGAQPEATTTRDDALSWAARKGHTLFVEMLLEEGADINTRDPQSGDTPLSYAVINKHEEVAALLIEKGAGVDVQDWNNQTALSKAAKRGTTNVVTLLLERGANIGSRDNFGQTPLFHALEHGNERVVELLLEKDPTLFHSRDEVGRSALLIATENRLEAVLRLTRETQEHSEILTRELGAVLRTISSPQYDLTQSKSRKLFLWAAKYGHMEVIEFLAGKGISYVCEDEFGTTSLNLAVRNSQAAVIEFLLKEGIQLNTVDGSGYAPLSWAFIDNNDTIACFLLSKGADPHKPVKIRPSLNAGRLNSPLFLAVRRGFERTVKLLLQMGADPNSSITVGSQFDVLSLAQCIPGSVLSTAVGNGNYSIVEALLDRGIDNGLCHDSLILAMQFRDTPLVSLIMRKGIRENWLIEEYGQSVLFCAVFFGHIDVVQSLLDAGMDANTRPTKRSIDFPRRNRRRGQHWEQRAGGNVTPLRFAAQEGHEAVVRALLDKKADLDVGSPLQCAIDHGHATVVELLLQHGARMDIQDRGSLLLQAARKGHHDLLKFLLRKGLHSESEASNKGCLVLEAASNKHIDVVRVLLEEGIDPNSVDKIGRNGLILAAEKGRPDIVDILLDYGVSAKSADYLGRTPLFLAAVTRNVPVVKTLLEKGNADPQSTTCAGRSPLKTGVPVLKSTI
ncbi:hypothetical protein DTO280E4_7527 [Paecilomyces variotii]|nr:hypothetical protein DTO280E4_7527 [Paecilomyces variotii]